MALISLRQLLDHAAEHSYGMPAFNVNNMEQIQAIMQAADAVDSPVILQGSAGARAYAGEPFLRHLVAAAVEMYPHIPVVMHQDHGADPGEPETWSVPPVRSAGALRAGRSRILILGMCRQSVVEACVITLMESLSIRIWKVLNSPILEFRLSPARSRGHAV